MDEWTEKKTNHLLGTSGLRGSLYRSELNGQSFGLSLDPKSSGHDLSTLPVVDPEKEV